jgi:hypothetical protein
MQLLVLALDDGGLARAYHQSTNHNPMMKTPTTSPSSKIKSALRLRLCLHHRRRCHHSSKAPRKWHLLRFSRLQYLSPDHANGQSMLMTLET